MTMMFPSVLDKPRKFALDISKTKPGTICRVLQYNVPQRPYQLSASSRDQGNNRERQIRSLCIWIYTHFATLAITLVVT